MLYGIFLTLNMITRIFHRILSIPQNNLMDLNNVMKDVNMYPVLYWKTVGSRPTMPRTMPRREVFGHLYIVGQDHVILNPNRLHVDTFRFCYFHSFEVYSSIDSSKMIGDSLAEVSNFHRLFLKLNRFICN